MKFYSLSNDIDKYTDEELLKKHKEIVEGIEKIGLLKIDGEDPIKFKKELINTGKNDLENVELVLKERKIAIPNYGILWQIRSFINKNKIKL